MVEVLRSNFEQLLPQIERDIKRADFIAIDTEFTGLKLTELVKPSLFDDGQARYQKLRQSISKFSLSQIGISAFVQEGTSNKYFAHSYNCYLFPQAFGPVDVRFMCQASSLQFLCKHDFDFNKYVYEGVSFLNNEQEQNLRTHFVNHDHLNGLDRELDEKALQVLCSQVADWLVRSELGQKQEFQVPEGMSEPMAVSELRLRFPQIWPQQTDERKIIVDRVTPERKKELDQQTKMEQEEKIMAEMLGFTRVFRILTTVKKPLIGHNNFMDLMWMYDKFYRRLPEKYSQFKEDFSALFPQIYDTKHIAATIRKEYEDTGMFSSTALGDLYKDLDSAKGRFLVLYSPDIKHAEGFNRYVELQQPHEAGYDSYMCGYVFLRLSHMLAAQEKKVQEKFYFHDYIIALRPYINCVNVIRGAVEHLKLDTKDPSSTRPEWLYIKGRKKNEPLTAPMIARLLSAFGSADVDIRSPYHAVVAVTNHRCAKDILRSFRQHETLKVIKYNALRHSRLVRGAMWCAVFVSGGVCVYTLWSAFNSDPV